MIYWPEDSTWDDNASSTIQKHRTTFMRYHPIRILVSDLHSMYPRYLTKITDQVVCLISDEHARAIVWNDAEDLPPVDTWEEDSDRLYTFEVLKTNEQEENVTARPGFTVRSSRF